MEDLDVSGLFQDRDSRQAFVNAENFLNSWKPVSFSGRILLHGVVS